MTIAKTVPSMLVAEVVVRIVERISPSFVRVAFGSPALADLGRGEGFDTRFKVIFPGPTGALPPLPAAAEDYYAGLVAMADGVRSPMRTYTIRAVDEVEDEVLLVADFVVHDDGHGPSGPACRWARVAAPGDVVHVMAPHRLAEEYGGTEFAPGSQRHLLLIGDETAVPAITRILADLGPGFIGDVFLEVPVAGDILHIPAPEGISVNWLPRGEARYGRRLVHAVRRHLALPPSTDLDAELPPLPSDLDVEVWETPRHSSAGEDVERQLQHHSLGHDLDGTYAWIAGESWAVKVLRRCLVDELDAERSQVAFMGYWREGVSMRS